MAAPLTSTCGGISRRTKGAGFSSSLDDDDKLLLLLLLLESHSQHEQLQSLLQSLYVLRRGIVYSFVENARKF
jgi:hypothetical protein